MYDPLKAFKAQPGRDATRVVEVKRLGIAQVQHVLIAILCLEYVCYLFMFIYDFVCLFMYLLFVIQSKCLFIII